MSELIVAILAAGASRRLGQPKQLIVLDDEPLLRRQCRVALEANVGHVTVVLGCSAEDCRKAIDDLPVAILENAEWEEGMASSVRLAAQAAIDKNASGLLILLVDQFMITSRDLQILAKTWTASNRQKACISCFKDYSGPPVILPEWLLDEVIFLKGDEGAKRVLSGLLSDQIKNVEMQNAIFDLDDRFQLADMLGKQPPLPPV